MSRPAQPPHNSGLMSLNDQQSVISEHMRTERETPARSQYTQGGRRHFSTMRRGTQSPSRMHDENAESQQHHQYYWGTNIDEREIEQQFERFINEFQIDENVVYISQLNQMMEAERFVMNIDGHHLHHFNRVLYQKLIYFPAEIIPIFDKVTQRVFFNQFLLPKAIRQNEDREQYENNAARVITGIVNLVQSVRVRDLNPKDINHLVSVKGILIRTSDIYPEMKLAYFKCVQCGKEVQTPLERGKVEEPTVCEKCRGKHTYEIIHNLCEFTDKQYIKLQEQPENVPEGDTPQTVSLMAYDDNVDDIKPGDRVTVTGVFRAQPIRTNRNQRVLKSIYNTYVDVISYQKIKTRREEMEGDEKNIFSEEAIAKFQAMADSPSIIDKLVYSIAPSIWGQDDIKKGILCQLFGGSGKEFSQAGKGRFRSEINVLLVGDPSTSKSQFLKYVHGLSQRGIYTSGKGSSAVGLTVYVTRDPDTREIVLESGALVLSDLGICCIDEFDKMDQNAKTILHEAMEQQTISVAKAGIVSQLNARTAVLAAANPVKSRYDPKKSVVENINLPPTILSRFDLIYLMLDERQADKDRKLAYHMLNLYSFNDKADQLNQIQEEHSHLLIDRETLSQYIAYARQMIVPTLSKEAEQSLIEAYVEMRKGGMSRNTITATPRQLESLIRISEALAKMELKRIVEARHVAEAVRLMQVATKRAAMDPITGKIDMDMITTGRTQTSRNMIAKLIPMIQKIVRVNISEFRGSGVRYTDLQAKLRVEFMEEMDQNEEQKQLEIERFDNELREALRHLEEEQFVMLAGDRNRPRIRAGQNALLG